jgi:hypothetical protein
MFLYVFKVTMVKVVKTVKMVTMESREKMAIKVCLGNKQNVTKLLEQFQI